MDRPLSERRALLESGRCFAPISHYGTTPLFVATQNGHEAMVRALIESGADVNAAENNGWTPLSVSMTPVFNVAQGGHAAIVQLLRDAGAV